MIVIPAIDLRGGRAVRLLRGDPHEETSYDDDPVAVAVRFQEEGARRLHVVDLDAALDAGGDNREVIRQICYSVVLPVQVGGGLRTLEDIAVSLQLSRRTVKFHLSNLLQKLGVDSRVDLIRITGF